jgi:molybdopterin converting factor small subunit
MAQLDPETIQTLVAVPVVFGSITVVTVSIIRYKLKKKELEMQGSDAELGPEVDALRDDLADLQEHTQAQLAEIQERLDFAERLLTDGRESQEDRRS